MKNYYFFILFLISLVSCKDEFDYQKNKKNYPEYTLESYYITDFVHRTSSNYYLWNKNIPQNFDATKWNSPQEYFDSFREAEDNISKVLEDYQKTANSFNNIELTDGIKYKLFYNKEDKTKLDVMVALVYDNTPAQKAGIMRGDIITKIDNQEITVDNYQELLNKNQYTLTYHKINQENDQEEYTSPLIIKESITINPVVCYGTTNNEDLPKTGFIMYDAFTSSDKEIKNALKEMADENIKKIIFDLRYNSGGYSSTLLEIASIVAGKENEGKIFLTNTYNDILTASMKKEYGEDYLNERFTAQDFYLDVDEIFYLVSDNSASASEELIAGLMPYKKTTIIGSKTFGKYTSCSLFKFDEQGLGLDNWCLYLIIGSCKNSKNEMNFKGGFTPDYFLKEDFKNPIGDSNEILLNQALNLIYPSIAKKQVENKNDYQEEIFYNPKPMILIKDNIKLP